MLKQDAATNNKSGPAIILFHITINHYNKHHNGVKIQTERENQAWTVELLQSKLSIPMQETTCFSSLIHFLQ